MSKRSYPHYAGKLPGKKWPPSITCEACDAPATCYADVQWSWFRGDDEAYRVCDVHLKLAREDVRKLAAMCEADRMIERSAVGKK
jgi:hypothetical protein